MHPPIRWGILATGAIARTFAADLRLVDGAELAAVGSRTTASAEAFAQEFGAAHAYGSNAEVASDPDVDVIYVATPHALHFEQVMTCFDAGKHVLCEKALTLNARDSARLIDEARARNLFFMEAMWMRCNPNIRAMLEVVAAGTIGEVTSVGVDYGFLPGDKAKTRIYDPTLGASALLDIGIYALTFSWLFLGPPQTVRSVGTLSEQGIDIAVAAAMTYERGATAAISCTLQANTPCRAYVAGTLGRLEVPYPFHAPIEFAVYTAEGRELRQAPVPGFGYTAEIDEVHRCLQAGLAESSLVPLDETLALMHLMDQIRADVGSVLPGDAAWTP